MVHLAGRRAIGLLLAAALALAACTGDDPPVTTPPTIAPTTQPATTPPPSPTTSTSAVPSVPRLMAVGDSITEDFGQGGWRGPLQQMVGGEWVGPRSDVAGAHLAVGGFATCDFYPMRADDPRVAFRGTAFPAAWSWLDEVARFRPTVLILDVGTNNHINDLDAAATGAPKACPGTQANIVRMLDDATRAPGVTGVVVTTIEDATDPIGTDRINEIIRSWVATQRLEARNVCLAEVPDAAGLTIDRWHLDPAGRGAWASTLRRPVLSAIAGTCASPQPVEEPVCAGGRRIDNVEWAPASGDSWVWEPTVPTWLVPGLVVPPTSYTWRVRYRTTSDAEVTRFWRAGGAFVAVTLPGTSGAWAWWTTSWQESGTVAASATAGSVGTLDIDWVDRCPFVAQPATESPTTTISAAGPVVTLT